MTLAFVSGGWLLQGQQARSTSAYERERLFEEILSYVARYYVDTVTTSDLYDMAIEGMLDRLNDPYTSFLRPEVYEELTINTSGKGLYEFTDRLAGVVASAGASEGLCTVLETSFDGATRCEAAG